MIVSKKRITAKDRIITAAWDLFMEKGYEETTLQDIIERSGSSRGAFYHHFRSKEDLLFTMAWYFDQDYDGWLEKQDPLADSVDLLYDFIILCAELVDRSKYGAFLPELYGLEVMTEGRRYILDEKREFFRILFELARRGISRGEIKQGSSALEIARGIASLQRGLVYSWLLEEKRMPLIDLNITFFKPYLDSIRP